MSKLALALTYLEMMSDSLTTTDMVAAFFAYLNLGGYLSDLQIEQAVDALAAAKLFQCNTQIIANTIVKQDLKNSCALARTAAGFDAKIFLDNFACQEYFALDDVIDLITFLQQTAFARHFGAERDTLQTQPWMLQNANAFVTLAEKLGVINNIESPWLHYCGIGIMGSVSLNCRRNFDFFLKHIYPAKLQHQLSYDAVWGLTGQRELSLGLDAYEDIVAVAAHNQKPLHLVKKIVGNFEREFAHAITEPMLINYLWSQLCPQVPMHILESGIQPEHWRATGQQSANDIAALVVHKILQQELKPDLTHDCYYFLVIAVQPAILRMVMQIERALAVELRKHHLTLNIKVLGCGPGIEIGAVANTPDNILARINSELAALMAERYYNARLKLHEHGFKNLRSPKSIMFATRTLLHVPGTDSSKKTV